MEKYGEPIRSRRVLPDTSATLKRPVANSRPRGPKQPAPQRGIAEVGPNHGDRLTRAFGLSALRWVRDLLLATNHMIVNHAWQGLARRSNKPDFVQAGVRMAPADCQKMKANGWVCRHKEARACCVACCREVFLLVSHYFHIPLRASTGGIKARKAIMRPGSPQTEPLGPLTVMREELRKLE